MALTHFKYYTKDDLLSLTDIRRFETKLGERLKVVENPADLAATLKNTSAKFVVMGVPEDLGIKANMGMGGAESAWGPFLHAFLNIQSNDFLDGAEILLLGYFDFSDLEKLIEHNAHDSEERVSAHRHAVSAVDNEVEQLVHLIAQNKKMPIVIGGGQNNAYPCIKGAAKGWHKAGVIDLAQINAINLDTKADYGPMEGRHNGNAFKYAEEDGYLKKYCVIGLHENYITQNTWMDIVNNPFVDCITFEDIFLHEKRSFINSVSHATGFTEDTLCGIELDLSCIKNTISFANNPVGISSKHARQYLNYISYDSKPAYLHICEGTTHLLNGKHDLSTGKLLAYLVSDFVKGLLMQLNS